MNDTVYLSNWSSYRTPGHHGRGLHWTIMAQPSRPHEYGDGKVRILTPTAPSLRGIQSGRLTLVEYRRLYQAGIDAVREVLVPGTLMAWDRNGDPDPVSNGDTLCCACSRAKAAAGECHRVWAAEALARAGWIVVLDGTTILPEGVVPRTTLNDVEVS